MDTLNLFNKLPENIFKPLALSRRRLNWHILLRLHDRFFESELHESEYGHPKSDIVSLIQLEIESHPTLWVLDEGDDSEPDTSANVRANQLCNKLIEWGWLHEERHAYQPWLSMPNSSANLLGSLIEICEGRPLVVTGNLKKMRISIDAVINDPSGQADTMHELTKDAVRFSRHLNSIRGSIKELYDKIHGQHLASDVIRDFFDDFIRQILIKDYATIKTSDHPLHLRSYLLDAVNLHLRSPSSMQQLLGGYQALFEGAEASVILHQDLHRLETVFYNIEQQIEAIDTMKGRYERRVDAVIDYARRSPPQTSTFLRGLIETSAEALSAGLRADQPIPFPLTSPEPQSDLRLYQPRKPRTPPQPALVKTREVDVEVKWRIRQERLARQATEVKEARLIEMVDTMMQDQFRG